MQTVIEKKGYDPAQNADNGNRFLTGNGYMGVRGTPCEFGPEGMAAVNLAGIYHQKGDAWREPLNAPNPLYFEAEGASLAADAGNILSHALSLDIADGTFHRETAFSLPGGVLHIAQERFCSMAQVHLLAQRVTLRASGSLSVSLRAGIDSRVWDIHGPHYDRIDFAREDGVIVADAVTDDGKTVCAALRLCTDEPCAFSGGLLSLTAGLRGGEVYAYEFIAAIYTSADCADPRGAALRAVQESPGYDALLAQQRSAWNSLWDDARVIIDGDPRAEFAVNYSLYHLMSIAPRHARDLSVPARGLSGQTYKGAIFWDTEMFMLDFYLGAMPQVAASTLRYRIATLPGAKKKAAEYGLSGAFYAWESQEGGREGCSDYNVTDVFTGRPMRTFFRDKQIHISAAVVYGLKKYFERTGDDGLMREGGAQVILECARFYMSLMTKRILSDTYDLCDVVGPDEYHERVCNNAYTNEMARMTLRTACSLCPQYATDAHPDELAAFADAAGHLKRQQPDPQTGVIEQFDGYFALEDASVDAVRARLKDPREYWGGAYGVAAHTQVIKQADVIALLYMLGGYDRSVTEANYDYYEPRTEHGSSLSACMYALCACMIGRPEEAYPLFLKSAEADIQGGGKQWAGLVYIGGTHPAAAGGAYMVLLFGFLGLRFEGDGFSLHPCLPKGWTRVSMNVWHRGTRRRIVCEALPS
ncbi:MAG: glycoside hydrolase family 65 protein [Clostridia bacterium]|nr:glycoside hydrolase family 65 protein [Clostridia bacterium]